MRRQARMAAGGALAWRSASALQIWLWLLIFIFQNEFRISRSIQPGYLDFDNLPDTNFTCAGKVIGGYYADLETSCQMFHVCTVGQQEEPMDIKFLCLNGTVFDQETRVCERVDEVDCTKSERFYSLNLELYGSTLAPPAIESDQQKPQATEESHRQTKPSHEPQTDSVVEDSPTTSYNRPQIQLTEVPDSTEDPVLEIKKEDPRKPQSSTTPQIQIPDDDPTGEDYEDDRDYEDYSHPPTTTHAPVTTTESTSTVRTTTTTYTSSMSSSRLPSLPPLSPQTHYISSPTPILSSLSPPAPSILPSVPPTQMHPTLNPVVFSPQEFSYPHRGPAISYQTIRPADGVYITHAPPQQYDHFQYESSRTAPRPAPQQRPTPFVQRQPAPFRPTTLDPRDQLLRPGPTYQPSEKYETTVKHRQQNYPASSLPAQRPLPFNPYPYYYDRKRSDDVPENESSLSARSVAPPTVTERPPQKPKSPPRVIVTASASVSDSNGKRLNYTVGNVVSAVKPIVAINYDDYKESDLLFDPFFLDVPKLQKRRKTRSNKRVFTVPATATVAVKSASSTTTVTSSPVTSRATTIKSSSTTITSSVQPSVSTSTAAWNPNDYVDDNYEPHAYIPPISPIAMLVSHELKQKYTKERQSVNDLTGEKDRNYRNSKVGRVEHSKLTSASASIPSSQSTVEVSETPPSPPPIQAPECGFSQTHDCRTRA